MDLSNSILDLCLLILVACVGAFIRYVYTWQRDMHSVSKRLNSIENELQHHFESCPISNRQAKNASAPPLPVINEEKPTNIELIRYHIQLYYPSLLEEISTYALEKLTPTDELLCMMIKLEYNNKEIASILSITNSSVLTARYRLKKKLQLPPDAQLDFWISLTGKQASTQKRINNNENKTFNDNCYDSHAAECLQQKQ